MKCSSTIPFLMAALTALVFALPASATLDITSSPAPPSGNSLLAYDGVPGGSYELRHGSGEESGVGQTFRLADPATLDRVTLLITPQTAIAGEGVELWIGPFSGPEDDEMNDPLQVEVGVLPDDLEIGETVYLTFDLTDIALEADVQYGFLLFFRGGGLVNFSRAQVHHLGQDAYLDGRSLEWAPARTTARDTDLIFYLAGGGTTEGPALYLQDGRFSVQARWRTKDGNEGVGTPEVLTPESGWFWFFRPDNVEVLVKVLDACVDPYWHYWVFAAGMTDVEVTLTVTDTLTLEQKIYTRPMGVPFETLTDIEALSGCSG